MVRLLPRQTEFFDMFGEMARNMVAGAQLLKAILDEFENVEVRAQQLKELERKGDEMAHTIFLKLNQTSITPFAREDIHALTSALDDVLDSINAAGERLVMFKISHAPVAAAELAELIVRQCEQVEKAVVALENHSVVLEACLEIRKLENEADHICRDALAHLFEKEKDAIHLIKLKDLLETLEKASDKTEAAAQVLKSVVLKNA